jgi:hypothetical protein
MDSRIRENDKNEIPRSELPGIRQKCHAREDGHPSWIPLSNDRFEASFGIVPVVIQGTKNKKSHPLGTI